jgi:hypothetical protein
MNEILSFSIILTKINFVTANVASLIIDSTCFVLGLPFVIFILTHILVKCHLKTFITLSWGSKIFWRNQILRFAKPDSPVLTDLLQSFFFGHTTILWYFSLQPNHLLWDKLLYLLKSFTWSFFYWDIRIRNVPMLSTQNTGHVLSSLYWAYQPFDKISSS